MLLLVVDAQLDDRPRRVRRVVRNAVAETEHRLVHVGAVREYLLDRGPRDQPALRAAVPLSSLHVVRVEKIRVARVGAPIGRVVRGKQERFVEPARVREVPLGGTHVGHRAHHVVLGPERGAEPLRLGAHGRVPLRKRRIR